MPDQCPCSETDTLQRIEKHIVAIEHSVNGNGSPGLKLRVHDLEQFVIAERTKRQDDKSRNWSLFMLALANILFLARGILEKFIGG